jgi:hypothetical protein
MVVFEIPFASLCINVRAVGQANATRKASLRVLTHVSMCVDHMNRGNNKLFIKNSASKLNKFVEETKVNIS